jgi:NADH-quinone oxidoreductase subunit J
MTAAYAVFFLYLTVITVGAGFAALSSSLVRALVGLLFSFMGVAGMYMLMQAPFLAFMQLLIYAGAVSVLIFFALMLAHADSEGDEAEPPRLKTLRAIVAGGIPLAVLGPALLAHPVFSIDMPKILPVAELGDRLMADFTLPFELISVILLVAMAGGVFLIWERR